jgi:hypothetical protein
MYNYRNVEGSLGKRDYFPNTSTEAYFDPQSQTIHLNRISGNDFSDAIAHRHFSMLRTYLSAMLHEITHWADLVGTLWGREYLRTVYDALRLLPETKTPGREQDFYKFIDLHDRNRRLMLSDYYRTVHPDPKAHDHIHPWGIQFSAGREFNAQGYLDDTRPILFTLFLDNPSGERIARQPIVAGALLEVNAVWSEIETSLEVISAMPVPERDLERRIFRNERLRSLYQPDLTLYTAPTHLLAQYTSTTDVIMAYELASKVSHVVLNLSEADFERITPPVMMTPWNGLFDAFRKSRDRGFAYAVICACSSKWIDGRVIDEWLDEALATAGLGSAASIIATAHSQMKGDVVANETGLLGIAERYLLSLGERVLDIRSANAALTPTRIENEQVPTPPMFDSNGDILSLAPKLFDTGRFQVQELHQAAAELHTWTLNLNSACR